MEPVKGNDATYNRPEGARPLDAPLLHANLSEYMHTLRTEPAWLNGDRNAITLVHTASQRVVLMALHQSAEMTEHSTEGAQSLQMLAGRVWLKTPEHSMSLDAGDLAAIAPGVPHSVFAEEESVLLLTMSRGPGGEF